MVANGLALRWDEVQEADWSGLLARVERSSLEQSWAYGEGLAAAGHARVRRAIIEGEGQVLAVVQVLLKRHGPLLTQARILRGPLFLDPALDWSGKRAVLRAIGGQFSLRRRELLIWLPELADGLESQAALRACGLRQVVTGYGLVACDLTEPIEELRGRLRGSWRRDLAAAERHGLAVRRARDAQSLDWLIGRAETHRRRRGYAGPTSGEIRAVLAALPRRRKDLLLLIAGGAEPIAGVLFLIHGTTATYLLGWTGPEGRRLHAHNLLLWRAVEMLRERDLRWLDLGVVDASAPGLARFKIGMGGELMTLAGTFM